MTALHRYRIPKYTVTYRTHEKMHLPVHGLEEIPVTTLQLKEDFFPKLSYFLFPFGVSSEYPTLLFQFVIKVTAAQKSEQLRIGLQ